MTEASQTPTAPRRRVLWTLLIVSAALLGVVLVLYAWKLPPFSRGEQRTDDAYVRGQVTVISPQVAGYVASVAVQDFQAVKPAQLLAVIDDRIYRQRVEQARADLHAAQAALANSRQSRATAQGTVSETQAGLAGAQAELARAQAEARRVRQLRAGGWVAQAQVDTAEAALRAAQAAVSRARAQENVAETGVTSTEVGRGSLDAAVEKAQAALRLAEIDLANTRVQAPASGRLSEVAVRQGQYVTAGTQLMSLVPDQVWVVANLKETQMRGVRVGQRARLEVDALDRTLTGRVERISPAAGSEFSVIRPDNATGNFTKVAQRIPVRIALDPGQPEIDRLRPGMSVVAKIETR
ncbi:HlyD family secretion protein [Phenylobacterium sp. VNQ135]|uniref:HlyD family secretion protein n=1 Tax=Phenylobacterium sp. VNQ135 TaxID=3400922 RepID=UPI003C09E8E0